MNANSHKELNQAINYATAFADWNDLLDAISFYGYMPTLRTDYGSKKYRTAIKTIQEHLESKGFPYYNGTKVVK